MKKKKAPSKTAAAPVSPPAALAPIWSDELAGAWESMPPTHREFLLAWYGNGFDAGKAFTKVFGQRSRRIARVNAGLLLATANIMKIRAAIWAQQVPPVERMNDLEAAILEDEEAFKNPDMAKGKLAQLGAIKRVRDYHRLSPMREVHSLKAGASTSTIKPDLSGVDDLFGGPARPPTK